MSRAIYFYPHESAVFEKLTNVHRTLNCVAEICVMHQPAEGPWRTLPIQWRNDVSIFERLCEHGTGHPDPSQFPYWRTTNRMVLGVHGCDGCCAGWNAWLISKVLEA